MTSGDRWKYLVVELKPSFLGKLSAERMQAELDAQGARGWELVQLFGLNPIRPVQLIFRRPG